MIKRLLVIAALLAPGAANAEPISIYSNIAAPCTVTWDEPELALAWMSMVAGVMTPELFLSFFKATGADEDQMTAAHKMVDHCMGVAS